MGASRIEQRPRVSLTERLNNQFGSAAVATLSKPVYSSSSACLISSSSSSASVATLSRHASALSKHLATPTPDSVIKIVQERGPLSLAELYTSFSSSASLPSILAGLESDFAIYSKDGKYHLL